MFEWTNPKKVSNFTQYYLYLLFSYNGRIGPGDFARGFFFGYSSLLLLSFFILLIFGLIIDLLGMRWFLLWIIVVLFIIMLNILPLAFLPLKRLKDLGWGEDGRALIIFFSYIGTILFGLGPMFLLFICLFGREQRIGNPNGGPCTIFEDLINRREYLLGEGSLCLKRKDFKGAIRNYEKLGDKKLVIRTKQTHISYKFDLLHTQITRMVDKEVLCEDLLKMTNKMSISVNTYLGFKSSESKAGLENE
ncbi:MAG TPA: hypothetical protein QGI59_02790 [Candidatus Poseidoniia archaeon]|nr:hypothetical protein [Candidatus Poseidoniia archaeon]